MKLPKGDTVGKATLAATGVVTALVALHVYAPWVFIFLFLPLRAVKAWADF